MSDELEIEVEIGEDSTDVELDSQRTWDLPQDVIDGLRAFLVAELQVILDDEERAKYLRNVNEWRRQREAVPASPVKNVPWPNASNAVVPLTMSNTNGIYAKIKSFVKARNPRVMGTAYNQKEKLLADVAAEVLNFFNNSPFHVNLADKEADMLYDWISIGNQIMEWRWIDKRVKVRKAEGFVEKVVRRGPELVIHPIEDVLVRVSSRDDIQSMPMIGFRHRYFGYEIKSMGQKGFFDPEAVERVLGFETRDEVSENDLKIDQRMGFEPKYESSRTEAASYDLVQARVKYDTDGDGELEDLIVWIHVESEEILRVDYNPVGFRLITNGKYFPVPHKFYAIGLGKISYDMQEEVDTYHNLRVDTQKMSASGGIIRRRGTEMFNKGRVIQPGFEFVTDDPRADYVQWNFPDVTGSTITGENQARNYLETAIGAHDAFFGRPDQVAKSGTSFSLQNLQASRTDTIFDSIADSIVAGYNDLFQKELMLLLAYGSEVRDILADLYDPGTQGDKVEALERLLSMDPEDVPAKIKFSVQTTDLMKTEEAKRQNSMLKFQLYSMVFDKMTQLVPALSQGQMDEDTRRLILNGIVGYHDMLRETLELTGTADTESALMDVESYRVMARMMDQMNREQSEMLRRSYEQQRLAQDVGGFGFGSEQAGAQDGQGLEADAGQAQPEGVGPGGESGGF